MVHIVCLLLQHVCPYLIFRIRIFFIMASVFFLYPHQIEQLILASSLGGERTLLAQTTVVLDKQTLMVSNCYIGGLIRALLNVQIRCAVIGGCSFRRLITSVRQITELIHPYLLCHKVHQNKLCPFNQKWCKQICK